MRKLTKALGWAFASIVAVAFSGQIAGALAAVADVPAVQLKVNGDLVQLESHVSLVDTNLWLGGFEGAGTGWSLTNGVAVFATDPFLDYSFDVKNFSNQTLSFVVLLS